MAISSEFFHGLYTRVQPTGCQQVTGPKILPYFRWLILKGAWIPGQICPPLGWDLMEVGKMTRAFYKMGFVGSWVTIIKWMIWEWSCKPNFLHKWFQFENMQRSVVCSCSGFWLPENNNKDSYRKKNRHDFLSIVCVVVSTGLFWFQHLFSLLRVECDYP